jgi:hypothetical protein
MHSYFGWLNSVFGGNQPKYCSREEVKRRSEEWNSLLAEGGAVLRDYIQMVSSLSVASALFDEFDRQATILYHGMI